MLPAIAEEIRQKGKLEGKLEVAKKLKDEGLDISLISKATGITVEEIEKL